MTGIVTVLYKAKNITSHLNVKVCKNLGQNMLLILLATKLTKLKNMTC
jgi:hypothetical protein